MTRRAVLTAEDIQFAKQLRKEGKSNREIARHFEVGKTTIWENVFSTKKRERTYRSIFKKRGPDTRPCCVRCEIRMTRDVRVHHPSPVSIYQIPANFQMGDRCLGCYLLAKGLTHMDLVDH